jgi:hypothetical protein
MKDVRSRKSHDILMTLLTNPAKKHILLSIRSITVMSVHKHGNRRVSSLFDRLYGESHEKKWLLMADLLSKIPYVWNFTLQGTDQLSVAVLDALERYHPQAHLHIQNWTRVEDDEDHKNAAEVALARSPNLRTLQARLWDTTSHIDLRYAALERIVELSPHLEELDISERSSGLVAINVTAEEAVEATRMRKKFWDNIVISSNSIRSLRSRGENHMRLLKDVIDMSNLERLDVGYVDEDALLQEPQWLGHEYPQLRCLSFALSNAVHEEVHHAMNLFLNTCNSLDSLSIRDGASYIPLSTISLHGKTLRTLILHKIETANSDVHQSISLQDIHTLSEHCRMLEDITIDCDRTSTEDGLNEILAALAVFPLLHSIRIYLPLGIADEAARTPHIFLDEDEVRAEIETYRTNPFNPIEGSCWLENAWSLLRHEKKKNGSKSLKELHVKNGEWEREMSGGYPAGWVIWEAANRRYFIATPHERDDRPDDINVYIKGTKPYSHVDSHEVRRIPEFVDLWDCGQSSLTE